LTRDEFLQIARLPPEEREEAIDELAEAIVEAGATERDVQELQALVLRLEELIQRRLRPN
jgi:hypothetical protein